MREEYISLENAQGYLALPDAPARSWLMAIHGSGRGALDYRDTPFYVRQRDLAVECGCAFAALSVGQSVWGHEEALAKFSELYMFMRARGYAARCAVIASSAGGTLMYRFAQTFPERVALLLGIFPVWDMEKITLPSMAKAWGLEGEALRQAVAQVNPARHPERLPDVPIVLSHGIEDVAVPIADHSLALARVHPLCLYTTREPHSTHSFRLYDNPMLAQALCCYREKEELSSCR